MDSDKDYPKIAKFEDLVAKTELTENQMLVLGNAQQNWEQNVKSRSMGVLMLKELLSEVMGCDVVSSSGGCYSHNILRVSCLPTARSLRIIFDPTCTNVFEVSVIIATADRMVNRGADAKFLPEFYVIKGDRPWGNDILDVNDVVDFFKVIKVLSTYK